MSSRARATRSAWIARAGDRDLAFEVRGDAIVETGSGTTFDLLGRGTSGELDGLQLEAPQQMTSFWFSWAHFYPETELSEQP